MRRRTGRTLDKVPRCIRIVAGIGDMECAQQRMAAQGNADRFREYDMVLSLESITAIMHASHIRRSCRFSGSSSMVDMHDLLL